MEKKVLMIIILLIISTVLAIGLFFQSDYDDHEVTEEREKRDHAAETAEGYYSCPMHEDVVSKEAGSCPLCNMELVFIEGEHDHDGDSEGEYVCPMHPEVTETSPGSCPICGMNLVKEET